MANVEQEVAEQATGCRANPHGLGKYYSGAKNVKGHVSPGGDELTPMEAYDMMRVEGRSVEVPNAGAGSYREFFTSVGFSEVKTFETSSSAGDWTFGVKDGEDGDWFLAFQSNRYPRHGFEYSVDNTWGSFASWEDLCKFCS